MWSCSRIAIGSAIAAIEKIGTFGIDEGSGSRCPWTIALLHWQSIMQESGYQHFWSRMMIAGSCGR
ncbi:hypothetical protein CSC75_16035 [Pseudoxanthomonas wuyuanensis]|nr:hypothetical protein CSC75_16035 [Pseudoxanthomonas wuyuanensis]